MPRNRRRMTFIVGLVATGLLLSPTVGAVANSPGDRRTDLSSSLTPGNVPSNDAEHTAGIAPGPTILTTDDCEEHPPIRITQDHGPQGFTWTNPATGELEPRPGSGVVAGSGTPGDPFVIQGWCIPPTPGLPAITIEGTNAHVSVRDNRIEGPTVLSEVEESAAFAFGTGIRLKGTTDIAVQNNILRGHFSGVRLEDADRTRIANNTIVGNGNHGISLQDADHATITNNTFLDHPNEGLLVEDSDDVTIAQNAVKNPSIDEPSSGVVIGNSDGATIIGNEIHQHEFIGLAVVSLSGLHITHNHIEEAEGQGLAVSNIENANIANNTIRGNGDGLWLLDVNETTIRNNTIADNAVGLELEDTTVDSRHNWWGDASGPSGGVIDACTGTVADGEGDEIMIDESGTQDSSVCFDPWLTEPNPGAGSS